MGPSATLRAGRGKCRRRGGSGFEVVSQRARGGRGRRGAPPTGHGAVAGAVGRAAPRQLGGCDVRSQRCDRRYARAVASLRTRVADHARRENDLACHLLGGAKRDALQVRAVLQLQDGALALRDGWGAASGRNQQAVGQWRDEKRARRRGGRVGCVRDARQQEGGLGDGVPYPGAPHPRAPALTSDSSKPADDEAARAEARLDSGDVAFTAAGARAAARRRAEVATLLANSILAGCTRGG